MSEIFTDEQINEISNNIQKAVNEEINKQIENIMGEKEIMLKKLEEIENGLPPTRFLSDYEKGSIEGKEGPDRRPQVLYKFWNEKRP